MRRHTHHLACCRVPASRDVLAGHAAADPDMQPVIAEVVGSREAPRPSGPWLPALAND